MDTGFAEFRKTPEGRSLSPTLFSLYLRTLLMVGVFGMFGAEMAMSFRSFGVGPKVGIFGQFRTAQVG